MRQTEGLTEEEEVEEGEEVVDKVEEADEHKVAGKGVTLGTHHEPAQVVMIKHRGRLKKKEGPKATHSHLRNYPKGPWPGLLRPRLRHSRQHLHDPQRPTERPRKT